MAVVPFLICPSRGPFPPYKSDLAASHVEEKLDQYGFKMCPEGEEIEFWRIFFKGAGIPETHCNSYADVFVDNRITPGMLNDLTREILQVCPMFFFLNRSNVFVLFCFTLFFGYLLPPIAFLFKEKEAMASLSLPLSRSISRVRLSYPPSA
jgi:hypothetical protein